MLFPSRLGQHIGRKEIPSVTKVPSGT